MGGINKHPSCSSTWEVTTETSAAISSAMAHLMQGNTLLERVLLAEFQGRCDTEAAARMVIEVEESLSSLASARELLASSIRLGEANGNPYKGDFERVEPAFLARRWDGDMLTGCGDDVARLGKMLQGDHLSTARLFMTRLEDLSRETEKVIEVFRDAASLALEGRLKPALEGNEIPLQASFGRLLSRHLAFMKEYLVDSLIATEVVFASKGRSLLAS